MAYSERSQANWEMALKAMPQIHARLGSEENCQRIVLLALASRKTIQCARRQCGHMNTIPTPVKRAFPCTKCRKEISLTAKTFFHKKQKFKPRLVTLELIERDITLSANQTAKICKVSSDMINKDLQRLGYNAVAQLKPFAKEILSELCLSAVSRRTRKTPPDKPTVEEEFALQRESQHSDNGDLRSEVPDLPEEENRLFNLLDHQPIKFDKLYERSEIDLGKLCALLLSLELKGLVERLPGDAYALSKGARTAISTDCSDNVQFKKELSIPEEFVRFVKDFFQGVGRKNLQLYAVLQWLCRDRKQWPRGSLLKFCVSSPYVSYDEILEYVTPLSFYAANACDSS